MIRTSMRACALCAIGTCASTALSTTIGFDDQAHGTVITNQYQSLGVIFSNNFVVNGPGAATTDPVSGPNSAFFFDPVSQLNDYTVRVDFVVPGTNIPGTTDLVAFTPTDSSHFNSVFDLVAFNSVGAQIASASRLVDSSGAYNPAVDTEAVVAVAGIAYIEMKVSNAFGGNKVIEGDDLRFNEPVPAPGGMALLSVASVVMGGRRRRGNAASAQ